MAVEHGYGKIVTDGLVLCLDAADNNSYPGNGNTWYDLSGNGNNGTLTNMSANPLDSANGGSLLFDGVNDYIPIASAINAKTILAFIQVSTSGGDYVIYGLNANGADNWLGVNSNKVQFYGTRLADVDNFGLVSTTTLSINTWYQIGCTINGATAKIYLNGLEENSTTKSFTIGEWNTAPTLGRRGPISQRYFPGNISNVQVYNRVLSPQEVQQNYNATKTRFGL